MDKRKVCSVTSKPTLSSSICISSLKHSLVLLNIYFHKSKVLLISWQTACIKNQIHIYIKQIHIYVKLSKKMHQNIF